MDRISAKPSQIKAHPPSAPPPPKPTFVAEVVPLIAVGPLTSPTRSTVAGELLVVTIRAPLTTPVPTEAKVTVTVQPLPGAKANGGEPQVPPLATPNGLPVADNALTTRLVLPLLINATVCEAAGSPADSLPKFTCVGAGASAGAATAEPVPLSIAVASDGEPLLDTVSVPARAPAVPGEKLRSMVQLLPAAMTWPFAQPPDAVTTEKSAEAVMALIVTLPGPALLKLTRSGNDDWPTAITPAKAKLDRESDTAATGVALPVPVSTIEDGLPAAEWVIVSDPVAVPADAGAKVTLTVQDWLFERLAPAQLPLAENGAEVVTAVTPSCPPPVLVTVMLRVALVVPTCCDPKASEFADSVAAGVLFTPLPVRLKATVPPLLLEVMLRLAERAPVAIGEKLNASVQLLPAATVVPTAQVPASVKSPALVPPSVRPLMFNAALPLLVRITAGRLLLDPTGVLGKLRLVADSEMVGVAAAAVPDKLTDDGLPVALWAIDRVAVFAPDPVGENATLMVQLAPAARLEPAVHVPPAAITNSLALVPARERPDSVREPPPLLLTVTVELALVVPAA